MSRQQRLFFKGPFILVVLRVSWQPSNQIARAILPPIGLECESVLEQTEMHHFIEGL